ncbi:MAG: helix-turn-helix domain-containing protein [Afipia felis]|nr:helix-turn-helix domain-containing protein [Afipia felis]
MSFLAVRWALDCPNLSATQKLVLIAVCDRANKDGKCWPSQRNTAARCSLTERTVNSALGSLEKNGLIRRKRRTKTDGRRTSDVITVLAPDLFRKLGKTARR